MGKPKSAKLAEEKKISPREKKNENRSHSQSARIDDAASSKAKKNANHSVREKHPPQKKKTRTPKKKHPPLEEDTCQSVCEKRAKWKGWIDREKDRNRKTLHLKRVG